MVWAAVTGLLPFSASKNAASRALAAVTLQQHERDGARSWTVGKTAHTAVLGGEGRGAWQGTVSPLVAS